MPVTNESLSYASANSTNGTRLDIAANGLWGGRFVRSYMDVRVFNPLAPSNKNSITACYKKHENEKKCAYEQTGEGDRACVVHTTGVLSNRRYGSTGNNSLQKACEPSC